LPSYLTGEQKATGFVSDYPVLKNTHDLPDEKLRMMFKQNNQDIMLLTTPEVFKYCHPGGRGNTAGLR
jgi:hypothetical protein